MLQDLNKACFKCIFLYSMLLDHYLPHLRILSNSMFTHITQCSMSCTINRIFWLLSFLHLALWYNDATWSNEMRTFQTHTLSLSLSLSLVSNHPQNEPMRFKICRKCQKLKYQFEKCTLCWFMLHKNILTIWPKKTDFPLSDPYQPTVWW